MGSGLFVTRCVRARGRGEGRAKQGRRSFVMAFALLCPSRDGYDDEKEENTIVTYAWEERERETERGKK